MRGLSVVLVLVLVLVFAPGLVRAEDSLPAGSRIVEYVRTIDGDTIIVRDGTGEELHVRLFGVDCADLADGSVDAFAAAMFTARCLEDFAGAVAIEFDNAALTDSSGRWLAWVWFRPIASTQWNMLNEGLIGSGKGTVNEACQSTRYMDRLRAAAKPKETARTTEYPVSEPAAPAFDSHNLNTWAKVEWDSTAGKTEYSAHWDYFDVTNLSDRVLWMVNVDVFYWDSNGRQVASGMGNVTNIASGQTLRCKTIALDADLHDCQRVTWQWRVAVQ